jgi:hypothetical protein
LEKLCTTVTKAYAVNPNITFEVFIHKVDGLSDDSKIGKMIARYELQEQKYLSITFLKTSNVTFREWLRTSWQSTT